MSVEAEGKPAGNPAENSHGFGVFFSAMPPPPHPFLLDAAMVTFPGESVS